MLQNSLKDVLRSIYYQADAQIFNFDMERPLTVEAVFPVQPRIDEAVKIVIKNLLSSLAIKYAPIVLFKEEFGGQRLVLTMYNNEVFAVFYSSF